MEWIEIKSKDSISKIMEDFYGFHDSCIKESFYKTGIYVDEKEKSMRQDECGGEIRLIFQSQLCNAIEICFQGIKRINIYSCDELFNNIYSAKFVMEDELIYWANSAEWNENNKEGNTYIICKKAKYRWI